MKKILLLFFVFLPFVSFATDASLFDLDEAALAEEFSELQTLEEAVVDDPMMTLDQAASMNLVTEAFALAPSADGFEDSDFAFQWEGFLWGFLCCPIGLFVIAVNSTKTKDNKISFWIGVAVSSVVSLVYEIALLSSGVYY